jgi:hypothetical protein
MAMAIVIALIVIFIVFVWSYPANYSPNWKDFLVAFATSLGIMVFFYSAFPKYSLGRTGLVVLASITVSGFWAALLVLAWAGKLSKFVNRKTVESDEPVDVDSLLDVARRDVWRRDGGKCVRCGSEEHVDFDYIVPISRGGTHQPSNLRLLCMRCRQIQRLKERFNPNSSTRRDVSPIRGN